MPIVYVNIRAVIFINLLHIRENDNIIFWNAEIHRYYDYRATYYYLFFFYQRLFMKFLNKFDFDTYYYSFLW